MPLAREEKKFVSNVPAGSLVATYSLFYGLGVDFRGDGTDRRGQDWIDLRLEEWMGAVCCLGENGKTKDRRLLFGLDRSFLFGLWIWRDSQERW